jgi:electron transfer flavoprotein alpha subunit
MTTLLLADVANGKLGPSTAKVLTAALQLGAPVHILIAGQDAAAAAQDASSLFGADKVILADGPAFAHQLAEPLVELILQLAPAMTPFWGPAPRQQKMCFRAWPPFLT